MDALLAALIAAALAEQGDKLQILAADLRARFGSAGAVIAGLLIAVLANSLIAGIGGQLLHAIVPYRALTLLLAVALVSTGGAMLLRARPSAVIAYPRLGAIGASAFAALVLGFGGATQFLTFALAARADAALLAAAGATIGSAVAILPAVLLGADLPRRLPVRALRLGAAGLLLVAGVLTGLGALRLI